MKAVVALDHAILGEPTARFRLLQGHSFNTMRGAAYYEAGTEVSDSEVLDFKCTALMQALDDAAQQLLQAECDRLRQTADSNTASTERACLPGVGPVQCLPA